MKGPDRRPLARLRHFSFLLATALLMLTGIPAQAALTVGVEDTGQYGWQYGSNANRDSYLDTFAIAAGNVQDLSLRVAGHDIDSSGEVSVLLNNVEIGQLRVSPNNGLRTSRFNIPASSITQPFNTLVFRRNGAVGRWGVTNIKLEPVTGPEITITENAFDNTDYGYRFGASNHLGVLAANFTISTARQLLVSIRTYDADSADKIALYLDGTFVQHLPKTANNTLSQSLMYKLGMVNAGSHVLELRVKSLGATWGVTDLGIWSRYGPDVPLTLNKTNNNKYGWRFDGANDHIERVVATFPDTDQNAVLTVVGHDIDFSNEVLVYLNGKRLTGKHGSAYLSKGPDRGENSGDSFSLPAALIGKGNNEIEFRQRRGLGNRWGITRLRISRLSSRFTYNASTTGKVGRSFATGPSSVRPGVTNFSVSPTLPKGLTLNKTTGRITGTPQLAQRLRTYHITGRSNGLDFSEKHRIIIDPATIRVTVDARDGNADNITYRYKAVEGTVRTTSRKNVVDWTLPTGRGLHTLYVMVNDRNSGYTTDKILVSSDTLSVKDAQRPTNDLPVAPTKTVTSRGTVRGWLGQNFSVGGVQRTFYWPRVYVRLLVGSNILHQTRTNLEGQFLFNNVNPGTYSLSCRNPRSKLYESCGNLTVANGVNAKASVNYGTTSAFNTYIKIIGNLKLADNSICGVRSRLFDRETTAVVRLVNANTGDTITGNHPVNRFGDYAILAYGLSSTTPVRVLAACGAQQVQTSQFFVPSTTPANAPIVKNFKLSNRPPKIVSITARYGSNTLAIKNNTISTPAKKSDIIAGDEHFLSKKGIESRLGGCTYYRDIGAVDSCTSDGTPVGAINFADWKKQNGMAPYNTSAEVTATFLNIVDLNLVRRHHAVKTNVTDRAYYVCNYPGALSETQSAINSAIDNAVKGKNLVACVAMSWSAVADINNNLRFIKFYVFGPNGELMSSVDLDGRGDKYLPGACVNCHGGESHAGAYPEDNLGKGALGSFFLPFDIENLRFSTANGLRFVDQAVAIKELNQNMLNTGTTTATNQLIANWYPSTSAIPNTNYVPPTWVAAGKQSVYNGLIKPYCRLCHVALKEAGANGLFNITFHDTSTVLGPACTASNNFLRSYHMPQSLHTFDRFWNDSNAQTLFVANTNRSECQLKRPKNWPQ